MWSIPLELHGNLATAQTLQMTTWALVRNSNLARQVQSVVIYKAMKNSFLFPTKSLTLRQAIHFHKIPWNQSSSMTLFFQPLIPQASPTHGEERGRSRKKEQPTVSRRVPSPPEATKFISTYC